HQNNESSTNSRKETTYDGRDDELNKKGMSAILLAAGFSSRMGKLKALLPWQGKTLIEYQIEQIHQARVREIVVVLGYQADQLHSVMTQYDHLKIVRNDHYKQGKSSSIRIGASNVSDNAKGIFICNVDQPVPSHTLTKMSDKLIQSAAIIPVYENKRGHPILFHGNLKDDLLAVRENTKGLRQIVSDYAERIMYLEVQDPSILFNFNKPEDYLKNFSEGGLP